MTRTKTHSMERSELMNTLSSDATVEEPAGGAASNNEECWPDILASDLSAICGIDVSPADLLGRHDGTVSPFVGLLVTREPAVGQAVEELVRLWSDHGLAEAVEPPALRGPAPISVPSLEAPTGRLIDGLQFVVGGDSEPIERLSSLVATAVELIGGVSEAWYLRPGVGAESMPGWVARLHARAAFGRLSAGASDIAVGSSADVTAAELYGIAGALYTKAASDSLWVELHRLIRTEAFAIINAHHGHAGLDLDRVDGDYWRSFDRTKVLTIPTDHVEPDTVLQIVRLPVDRVKGIVAQAGRAGQQ